MKKIMFLVTFLLFSYFANAQNNSFDQRLLSKFSKEELNEMQSNNTFSYSYWNFYVANAYEIVELANEKANTHEIKGTVKIQDINTINIFDLHYVPLGSDYQYYQIEGTQKLLVILSEEQIKAKFSKSIK